MEDEKQVTPTPEEGEDKTKENEVEMDDKDLKSALAQKEHFREKAEKLEKEREELLAKVEEASKKEVPKTPETKQPNDDVLSLKEKIAKIEFAQKHQNIDAGDIEQIFELASLNSKTPEDILENNPMVKAYLKEQENSKKVADATPDTTRGYSVTPEKPVSEMSRDEHREWAEKIMS